jgi:hypothetical protein
MDYERQTLSDMPMTPGNVTVLTAPRALGPFDGKGRTRRHLIVPDLCV